jgi:hypothetical protein
MTMGIITLCFNRGGFRFVYSFRLLPHSYEGNPVQSCSNCRLVVVYFSESCSWDYSHGLGIKYILEFNLRVAIMSIYMLYGCWMI